MLVCCVNSELIIQTQKILLEICISLGKLI